MPGQAVENWMRCKFWGATGNKNQGDEKKKYLMISGYDSKMSFSAKRFILFVKLFIKER